MAGKSPSIIRSFAKLLSYVSRNRGGNSALNRTNSSWDLKLAEKYKDEYTSYVQEVQGSFSFRAHGINNAFLLAFPSLKDE